MTYTRTRSDAARPARRDSDGLRRGLWVMLAGALLVLSNQSSAQPVGSELVVNPGLTGSLNGARIAIRPDNSFAVVWGSNQNGDTDGGISLRVFDSASVGGAEVSVNTTTVGLQTAPAVATSSSGVSFVVWQGPGIGSDIFGRRFSATGAALGDEFVINTGATGEQTNPSVAMSPDGRSVVVWLDQQSGNVMARLYSAAGVAGATITVGATSTLATPSVALDWTGNPAVAWVSGTDVNVQRYTAAGAAQGSVIVANTTAALGEVSLGRARNGDFVVAYSGTGPSLFGRRYGANGNPRAAEFLIDSAPFPMSPAVAVDENWDFVVAYTASDVAGRGIKARRYRGDGQPVAASFGVNTTTLGDQKDPGLAMTATARFIIAFQSDAGVGTEIRAQQYGFGDSVTVLAPTLPGTVWSLGTAQKLRWGHTEAVGSPAQTFDLKAGWDNNFVDGDGCDTEAIATGLSPSTSTSGVYTWNLPMAVPGGCPAPTTDILIRAVAQPSGVLDDSETVSLQGAPSITATKPSNEAVPPGTPTELRWNHNLGLKSVVRVDLSRDNGATYPESITASTENQWVSTGNFLWAPTGDCLPGRRCRVKVTWLADGSVLDESDPFNIHTCSGLSVSPSSLTPAVPGNAYSQALILSGGLNPTLWTLVSGVGTGLPAGLSLSGAGSLSGTPTGTGTFTFRVNALDDNLCSAIWDYTLETCPVITLSPTSVPSGVAGTAYPGASLSGSGGASPYNFAVTTGSLPSGLTLSTGGALSGTPSTHGTFNITVTATDANGCTGTRAYTLAVAARPVLTAIGNLAYTENGAPAAVDGGLTVTDADSANLTGATVAISANYVNGQDALSFTNTPNISGVFAPATATMTLSGTDTVANYQLALQNVRYNNTSENPSTSIRSVTWQVTDGANPSATSVSTITVTAVNDAPSLTGGATLNYTENQAATVIDGTIVISDVDNTTLSSATVQITANFATGQDTLSCGTCGAITQSFSAGTGTLTLTGSASPAAYQTALRSVRFVNNSENPTTAPRTISYQVNDGAGANNLSNLLTSTVNVTATNDAPLAAAKSTTAQANMKRTGINLSLLVGSSDPDDGINGCSTTLSVSNISSGAGGTVSNVNLGAGTFDFEPNPGFTGAATASYTLADNGCPGPAAISAPATITITVSGPVIWFVDDSAAAGGDGRLGREFQTVGAATAAIGVNTNHKIFVHSGTYTQGASLNTDGWLIGQGVSGSGFDTVFSITPPAGTIARPAIGGTRPQLGSTVTMGTNSQVKGLNIVSITATGITATSKTGLVTSEVSVTTTTGVAVNITGTLPSPSGGALSFTSVSSNGAPNGIVLQNHTTGSFTVTGDGANAGSGGSVQNSSIRGARFSGASNVSLSWMNFTGNGTNQATAAVCGDALNGTNTNCGAGIDLQDVSGVVLDRIAVAGGAQIGINGNGVSNLTLTNSTVQGVGDEVLEDGVQLVNLLGTASVSNCLFSGNFHRQFEVQNSSGVLSSFAVTGSAFDRGAYVSTAAQGLLIAGRLTAVLTASIKSSQFVRNFGAGFFGQSIDNAAVNITLGSATVLAEGNTFLNNSGALQLVADNASNLTFVVGNNSSTVTALVTSGFTPFTVRKAISSTGMVSGTVVANTIGANGVALSGNNCAGCNGMTLTDEGASGGMQVTVANNVIQHVNQRGIEAIMQLNDAMSVAIVGNTIRDPDGAVGQAVFAQSGNDATDTGSLCTDVRSNTIGGLWDTGVLPGGRNMRVRQAPAGGVASLRIAGLPGSTPADAVTYLNANNTNALASATATASFLGGAGVCF